MQQKLRALIATVELTKDKVGLITLKELLEEAKKLENHKANVINRIFIVVDPDGDAINYWRTVDDARKHARELSEKYNILFEVISEPIF